MDMLLMILQDYKRHKLLFNKIKTKSSKISLIRRGSLHCKMVDNILKNVQANNICRLDVNFFINNDNPL